MSVTGEGTGVSDTVSVKPQPGYVAMGTAGFYSAQFDNFNITKGYITIHVGIVHNKLMKYVLSVAAM